MFALFAIDGAGTVSELLFLNRVNGGHDSGDMPPQHTPNQHGITQHQKQTSYL